MKFFGEIKLAVIGLGYVGLPLAVEFGKKFPTVGFDISIERVKSLSEYNDETHEVEDSELRSSHNLIFSSCDKSLRDCNIYIVAVPTPVDIHNKPDLLPLINATKLVAKNLKKNDLVIYESTVYPGATEDDCVPVLEKISGLKFNSDFHVGYSPERVNPGDKTRKLKNIMKITSGSTPEVATYVDSLYREIIEAGTYMASSIKVAEAAKVIENTQRDINIALMNELAIIFKLMNIDTSEVLTAAGTKWNFLKFEPGLVGGHCIGVDPYYLTYKAQELGYHPEIILSGRRLNDGMGGYITDDVIKLMAKKNINIAGARVLIMGLTFKENCSDIRNSRIISLMQSLLSFNVVVDIYDPWVNSHAVFSEYGISTIEKVSKDSYDAILLTVKHDCFRSLGIDEIKSYGKTKSVIYDVKGLFSKNLVDGCL